MKKNRKKTIFFSENPMTFFEIQNFQHKMSLFSPKYRPSGRSRGAKSSKISDLFEKIKVRRGMTEWFTYRQMVTGHCYTSNKCRKFDLMKKYFFIMEKIDFQNFKISKNKWKSHNFQKSENFRVFQIWRPLRKKSTLAKIEGIWH